MLMTTDGPDAAGLTVPDVLAGVPLRPLEAGEIDEMASRMVAVPQSTTLLEHHVTAGMYARSILIPAGALVVGLKHRADHFCFVTSGVVTFLREGAEPQICEAPWVEAAKAGTRRVVLAITDVVITTVQRTDKTDPAEIEAELMEPCASLPGRTTGSETVQPHPPLPVGGTP